jgi:hypothetical protein
MLPSLTSYACRRNIRSRPGEMLSDLQPGCIDLIVNLGFHWFTFNHILFCLAPGSQICRNDVQFLLRTRILSWLRRLSSLRTPTIGGTNQVISHVNVRFRPSRDRGCFGLVDKFYSDIHTVLDPYVSSSKKNNTLLSYNSEDSVPPPCVPAEQKQKFSYDSTVVSLF